MHFSWRIERAYRALPAIVLLGTLPAVAQPTGPVQLDSQVVVGRYLAALEQLAQPKYVVFSYRVSQAGAHNIEQTHRIFRAGSKERDETISIEGDPVKSVRVVSAADRYAILKLAPRGGAYTFLFLETRHRGKHLDYVYATEPLAAAPFTVTEVTIDGDTYLPSLIRFKSVAGGVHATGSVAYSRFSHYWLPTLATATADVDGRATRERIAWTAYSFPSSLPAATFVQPKSLPLPAITPSHPPA
jgi:hypothetical protein